MANLLNHLISNEVGTSAFLATLLDMRHDHPVFVEARAAIALVLRKHGLELSSPAPVHVELEYSNIDIVAVWSGWTILVENKVASASVTRGQLSGYYSGSLRQIERRGFLKHAGEAVCEYPLCFVYLTPTPVTGAVEFEDLALAVERSDKKMHVGWNELLEHFMPLVGRGDDHAAGFFDAGVECIREVLEAAKRGKLPEDERRQRLQVLMNELKGKLQGNEAFVNLAFCRWSDRSKEQLFATGPQRSAYVGLYVSCDGSLFPSEHTIRAVGEISFDVAGKHRTRLRGFLDGKSRDEWSAAVSLPIDAIEVNSDRGSLVWRFALPEMRTDEFLRNMEKHLEDFSGVFGPILMEGGVSPVARPFVAGDALQALHY